jgi:glutathione synthase/RimK-type ligase-like ATP-grasp enzyme
VILIWGVPNDRPVAAVRELLRRRHAAVVFLDQHDILDCEVTLSVGANVDGQLRCKSAELDLAAITAAYLRPYDSRRLPELADAPAEVAARVASFDDAMLCWSEMTLARVINRPSAMASNLSKPHQLALIHAQGFRVPETLVTTDVDELDAFWKRHVDIIYKSISGVRSIVSRLTPEHQARFDCLAHSPVQFQQWIPGSDVRVHVVGDEVYACDVGSSAVDYRYPQTEDECPQIRARILPRDVAERCIRLARSMNLELAGIDLRCTPEGEWHCFEVNASPAFTYYAQATGQPIEAAVAGLLQQSEPRLTQGLRCA